METKFFSSHEEIDADLKSGPICAADIEESVYRSHPAINISSLKSMSSSASKFAWERKFPREPSPAMVLGSAIHAAMLQPDVFDNTYYELPKIDRRTKAGKEKAAEVEAANVGKIGLSTQDMDTVNRLHAKAYDDPWLSQFFNKGLKERSFFRNDAYTGLTLKGKIDNWRQEGNVVIDLKTTDCAAERVFKHDIVKYDYISQAAFYYDMVHHCSGEKPFAFIIVAVEKTKDCDVNVFHLDNDALGVGRAMYRKWLDKYAECVKTGQWPGYDRKFINFSAPNWMLETYGSELDV